MDGVDPDFSRVVRAVGREEADRVPLIENLVDFAIQSRFLGRPVTAGDLAGQVEFWTKAGYDYVPLVAGMMRPGRVTADSVISKILRERQPGGGGEAGEEKWNLEMTSVIRDRGEFETFPWEVAAKVELDEFRKVKALLPAKMKVVVLSGKIFTLSWMLMGFEHFCECLLDEEDEKPGARSQKPESGAPNDPQIGTDFTDLRRGKGGSCLTADVVKQVAEIQLSALGELLKMEHVGAVCAVDDIAYNTGPMISPEALRRHIFPWYREMARRCHEAGRLFFLHSDGDMEMILPDLIDLGVDALHPIDPTAMDIVRIKRAFGDRIALFGNVDTELLRSGTPSQVAARVKELLRTVAPGGGFGLGSGNSVPEWAALENYQAMRTTALECGRYPIAVG